MSKTTLATVKVMISYNFCHFEVSKQIEGEDLTQEDIDEARKDCQRLADKAIGQYQTAKTEASSRTVNSSERFNLEREVTEIKKKDQQLWSVLDKAKVKALEDYKHESKYNYLDDGEYEIH